MKPKSQLPLALDVIWIALFSCIIAFSFTDQSLLRSSDIFAINSVLVGITMMFSNKFKDSSKVCTVLNWIAMYLLHPRTKYNHYFWGLFICVMSIMGSITDDSTIETDALTDRSMSLEDWGMILFVLLINVLIGIYVARKHKQESI